MSTTLYQRTQRQAQQLFIMLVILLCFEVGLSLWRELYTLVITFALLLSAVIVYRRYKGPFVGNKIAEINDERLTLLSHSLFSIKIRAVSYARDSILLIQLYQLSNGIKCRVILKKPLPATKPLLLLAYSAAEKQQILNFFEQNFVASQLQIHPAANWSARIRGEDH